MSFIEAALFPNILMVILIVLASALALIVTQLYKNFMKPEYCLDLIMRFSQDELGMLKREAKGSIEFVSLALIGAVEYFGRQHMLVKQQRKVLAIRVLQANLQLSAKELSYYYAKAASYKNQESGSQAIFNGVKAAKRWLNYQSKARKLMRSSCGVTFN